jgi:ABC-type transport system involved in multi-copper enzyme maturation permease subunit
MKHIDSLVKKDLIYLGTSLKRLVLMAVVFSIILPIGNIVYAFGIPAIMGYLLTYGVFAYEEKNKMNLLAISLPVKRSALCSSKYITSLIYIVASVTLTILGLIVSSYAQVENGFVNTPGFIINMLCMLLATALIYHACILPVIMYFGAIQVRYVLFILYVGVFVMIGIWGEGALDRGNSLANIKLILDKGLSNISSLIILLVSLLVYMISYSIANGLYSRKEFR